MSKFAWIGYYSDKKFLNKFLRNNNSVDSTLLSKPLESVLSEIGPIKVHNFRIELSSKGKVVEGLMILAPLLPQHIFPKNKNVVEKKLNDSIKYALNEGAEIICLAGLLGDFLPIIREKAIGKVFYITGKNMLIATVYNTVQKAFDIFSDSLLTSPVAIFDSDSFLAISLAKFFANRSKKVILFDRKKRDIDDFLEFRDISRNNLKIVSSLDEIFSKSHLIVTTSLFINENFIQKIGAGSVVFDSIAPFWVAKSLNKSRKDVVAVESAWVSRGMLSDNHLDLVFPKEVFFACISEAILASSMDNICEESLSVNGANIVNFDRMSREFGFKVSKLKIGKRLYTDPSDLSFLGRANDDE
ncbi:MAG: hypothetical protein PHV17_08185 [Candidatus Omnitrophica bacterium]|nr:hypothetical protein [Candidatus Omnitrophota bacterium]